VKGWVPRRAEQVWRGSEGCTNQGQLAFGILPRAQQFGHREAHRRLGHKLTRPHISTHRAQPWPSRRTPLRQAMRRTSRPAASGTKNPS
jgi:hypothetical protein